MDNLSEAAITEAENNLPAIKSNHQFLNPNVAGLQLSPTLKINQYCKELAASGKRVYKLGLGQSPFPIPDAIVNALRLYATQKEYQHVQGLPELRQAVAGFHRKKDGLNFHPEHIMIGPGSKELLFLLQMIFQGEVIIPSPSWVSYLPQAKIIGNVVHIIHTDKAKHWRLQPQDLDDFCKARKNKYGGPYLLILNYPGNPDGITYTPEDMKALAQAAQRNNIYILSDEIYGQLHHQGNHVSIAKFYPEGTIVSSGLSKWCGAGGWRLGTFSFPPCLSWLLEAMTAVASETFTAVSAPIQYAAIQAFEGSAEIENYLAHARKILSALGNKLASILRSGNIEVNDPSGAFYLFLDFSSVKDSFLKKGIDNSSKLCEVLLADTGVAILPGVDFNRPAEELTARLAYVDFDGAKALAASYAIPLHQKLPSDFVEKYCFSMVEAAHLIVAWAHH